jgi:uncharacterized protein YodC (DUF2158 family)
VSELKAGDLVRLKSGGPTMTVEAVGNSAYGTPTVWVVWFDQTNKPHKATYSPDAVEKFDPNAPQPASEAPVYSNPKRPTY